MKKREPLYARAEEACFWELAALSRHGHPSVAAMARTLLSGQNVTYQGDPMQMLSLSAFLDKFLSRKAKTQSKGG
jgi:ribosome biogenesis protein MAK21